MWMMGALRPVMKMNRSIGVFVNIVVSIPINSTPVLLIDEWNEKEEELTIVVRSEQERNMSFPYCASFDSN